MKHYTTGLSHNPFTWLPLFDAWPKEQGGGAAQKSQLINLCIAIRLKYTHSSLDI